MKQMRETLVLVAGILWGATAFAQSGYYGGVNALVGFSDSDNPKRTPAGLPGPVTVSTDNGGVNGGLGLWGGYRFDKSGFDLELSSTVRARHDQNIAFISTGDLYGIKSNTTTVDLMVSGLYDIPIGTSVVPYVSAGAGGVWVHQESDLSGLVTHSSSSDDINFAWQVGGGLKYPWSLGTNLRLDYRYIDMGTINTSRVPTPTNDQFATDLTSHDVRLGVTWDF